MGTYSIVIHGAGSHDNHKTHDVETMVERFVQDLSSRGHSVEDARVVVGNPKEIRKAYGKGAVAVALEQSRPLDEHEDLDREARAAYERYFDHAGGKTFDGRPMPDWEKLADTESGRAVQGHWRAAVDWYGAMKTRNEHVVGPGTPGDHVPGEVDLPTSVPRPGEPPRLPPPPREPEDLPPPPPIILPDDPTTDEEPTK